MFLVTEGVTDTAEVTVFLVTVTVIVKATNKMAKRTTTTMMMMMKVVMAITATMMT